LNPYPSGQFGDSSHERTSSVSGEVKFFVVAAILCYDVFKAVML
jgi:hypothetical protein